MDPAAHFLTGAVYAKTFRPEKKSLFFFWIVLLAGLSPDGDVLLGGLAHQFPILFHRGVIHSYMAGIALSLPFAWALWKMCATSFLRAWLVAIGAFWVHVTADLLTNFGGPVLMPFTSKDYSLDLLSNFNWVIWLICLGLLWLLTRQPEKGRRATVLVLFFTLGFQFLGQRLALRQVPLENHKEALPHMVHPFLWRIHGTDIEKQEYRLYHVAPFLHRSQFLLSVPMMTKTPVVQAALENKEAALFLKHNRWPVALVERRPQGGWIVTLSNLMYYWRGHWGERLEVELDRARKVLSTRKVFDFW